MDGTCGTYGGQDTLLVRKRKGQKAHGRIRRWWRDDIKIDSSRNRVEGLDWIDMGQERDEAGFCKHGRESLGSVQHGKFLTFHEGYRSM